MQRGDGLAAAAGLDRGRCLAPPARGPPGRAAQGWSARHGRLRDRRLAHPGPQGESHTGPSPVDRARPGSKHHLIVDRHGTPLAVSLTGGNRHDVTQLTPLLDLIPRIRGLRGRPRHRPGRLFADRGYDYDKYRRVVERTFAWLHQFKRLRIRYEIHADLHLGMLQLACCIICLRRLRTSF